MKNKFRICMLLLPFVLAANGLAQTGADNNYIATLTAATDGPRPVYTQASGQVIFTLAEDGSLHYTMNLENIENVYMAHLHLTQSEGYGPMVAWLYPPRHEQAAAPVSGKISGVFCADSLKEGDLTGSMNGKNLQDLISAIDAGKVYINVHTTQYRSGELYGLIH